MAVDVWPTARGEPSSEAAATGPEGTPVVDSDGSASWEEVPPLLPEPPELWPPPPFWEPPALAPPCCDPPPDPLAWLPLPLVWLLPPVIWFDLQPARGARARVHDRMRPAVRLRAGDKEECGMPEWML